MEQNQGPILDNAWQINKKYELSSKNQKIVTSVSFYFQLLCIEKDSDMISK